MGVRIVEGMADGTKQVAVLYDSVTGTAFGPLFEDADEAQAFLESLATHRKSDARMYSSAELAQILFEWRTLDAGANRMGED